MQLIFAGDKSVLFFFTVAGCAFLTYYSRDSAISAQNALHEKRTLPGVSVYNVLHCGGVFTYFSANYTRVMPRDSFRVRTPHHCRRHGENLISRSPARARALIKRSFSLRARHILASVCVRTRWLAYTRESEERDGVYIFFLIAPANYTIEV